MTTQAALTARDIQSFYLGYLECAFWSSHATDAQGVEHESLSAFEPSTDCAQAMQSDCADFCASNADKLREAFEFPGYAAASAGHDFWLTRNGHGAGFWDRGLGKVGEALTSASKAYGGADLYFSDAGEVEQA